MREQRIAVEIDHDGRVTAEAEGFSGDSCLQDLAKLLDGLTEWETVRRTGDADEHTALRGRTINVRKGTTT